MSLTRSGHRPNGDQAPGIPPKLRGVLDYPYAPAELLGRDGILENLDLAWLGPEKRNIVVVIGWGGAGKTSLVSDWARKKLLSGNRGGVESYCDWSFTAQGAALSSQAANDESKRSSADDFINAALRYFGDLDMADSNAGQSDKGARLAELVGRRRTLLVLDGLEALQGGEGELNSDGLRALLGGLALLNDGLCIITTREQLGSLKPWKSVQELPLQGLSPQDGALLLTALGVTGADDAKRQVSEQVQGHALTLTLLATYLVNCHTGDISDVKDVELERVDQIRGHAAIEAHARWLEEQGWHTELAILRILGLFDDEADWACLNVLRKSPIPKLTEPLQSVTADRWRLAVTRLVKRQLIWTEDGLHASDCLGYEEQHARAVWKAAKQAEFVKFSEPQRWPTSLPPRGAEAQSLNTHPLIRDYFARTLDGEAAAAGHEKLFKHLRDSVCYWPEDLAGLEPLYRAIGHGCKAGLHEEAFQTVFWDRIQRRNEGYSHRRLGLVERDYDALRNLTRSDARSRPALLTPSTRALVHGLHGARLRARGRYVQAIASFDEAIDELRHLRDHARWLALRLRHKAEALHALGRLYEAEIVARECVGIAKDSNDFYQQFTSLSLEGHLLHHLGRLDDALARFKSAEVILRENYAPMTTLYSLWGFRYNELLLDLEEADTVCGRVRTTSGDWENGLPQRDPEGGLGFIGQILENLTEAKARLLKCQKMKTRPSEELLKDIEKFLLGLREAGRQDFLPFGRLARACCLRLRDDLDAAEDEVRNVWTLARNAGMRIFQAESWLECAHLFLVRRCPCEFTDYMKRILPTNKQGDHADEGWPTFIRFRYPRRLNDIAVLRKDFGDRGHAL